MATMPRSRSTCETFPQVRTTAAPAELHVGFVDLLFERLHGGFLQFQRFLHYSMVRAAMQSAGGIFAPRGRGFVPTGSGQNPVVRNLRDYRKKAFAFENFCIISRIEQQISGGGGLGSDTGVFCSDRSAVCQPLRPPGLAQHRRHRHTGGADLQHHQAGHAHAGELAVQGHHLHSGALVAGRSAADQRRELAFAAGHQHRACWCW